MNIFLDLDGTIIDSRQRIFRLFTDLTNQQTLSFEEYWHHKRQMRSNEWLLENLLAYDKTSIAQFRKQWFLLIESEKYMQFDTLFEPVAALLQRLSSQGHTIYIVTARQFCEATLKQVQELGIEPYVSNVFVTAGKKAKHELLSNLQVSSTDLFFGDTGLDIQTAKQIGVVSIAVLTGFRNREVLLTYQPDRIIESVWAYFE